MSTFLELCQDLREQAGISGSGPTAVTGQTGEMLRVVNWINKAYQKIQNMDTNWNFLRADFSFQTIASTSTYTTTAVNLTDHGSWKVDSLRCYLTSAGATDEQWLVYYPWEEFRDIYQFGGLRTSSGRPISFSVKPDQSLIFYPVPDAVYTVVGEYFKKPQEMAANSDEPLIPSQYQDVIMWRALMYYATYESAPELYAEGQAEYRRLMAEMRVRELPPMSMGGPLA
jgi:hypothetical protein